MISSEQPASWVTPDWHPDFGNAESELEHLRNLANLVLELPQLSVALAIPEPGLMFLVISREGMTLAEIYSNLVDTKSEQRKYGVFISPGSSEEEAYSESAPEVVRWLNSKC